MTKILPKLFIPLKNASEKSLADLALRDFYWEASSLFAECDFAHDYGPASLKEEIVNLARLKLEASPAYKPSAGTQVSIEGQELGRSLLAGLKDQLPIYLGSIKKVLEKKNVRVESFPFYPIYKLMWEISEVIQLAVAVYHNDTRLMRKVKKTIDYEFRDREMKFIKDKKLLNKVYTHIG